MADRFDLTIKTSLGSYPVIIGRGTADELLGRAGGLILADDFFVGHPGFEAHSPIWIRATEAEKTLARAEELLLACHARGAQRGSEVTAIGGGVVQDLATLVSSLYMRGLPWWYVPTTLMSMADSCIGGKSSINVGQTKNLVGNIYPPRGVVVDPVFISTLSADDIAAGLGEAAKICFCRGAESFGRYDELAARFLAGGPAEALIHHVLMAKQWFIEVDEFDQNERLLLNFGHTFAHAIEPACAFSINHGVAVVIGMLCAIAFARTIDGASGEGLTALAAHCVTLVGGLDGLGSRLECLDEDRFFSGFQSDKKHRAGEYRLILPISSGGVSARTFPADAATSAAIMSAVRSVVDDLVRSSAESPTP